MFALIGVCNTLLALSDLPCPSTFQVTLERDRRLLHIESDQGNLGTVVSSGYGILDFYDSENQRVCRNVEDELFDRNGDWLSSVLIASDLDNSFWVWGRSDQDAYGEARITILSETGERLCYMDQENTGEIVFFDAETDMPLAAVHRVRVKSIIPFLSRATNKWHFTITNAVRLQERGIPNIYLIWALTKHIQKSVFPGPKDLPYVVNYPD